MTRRLFSSRRARVALGFGFRCGFLGLLHMEIIQERLRREYDMDIIATYPSVIYEILKTNGELLEVDNPTHLPDPSVIGEIREPVVKAFLLCPNENIGDMMQLVMDKRGEMLNTETLDARRVMMTCRLPLNEILVDFNDKIKSMTRGYGSMDYEYDGYKAAGLVKLDILVNNEPVDAFSSIVHRDKAESRAFDALGALRHITATGYDHSWFLLNRRMIGTEFALSGSEQNPDLTGRSIRGVLNRARSEVSGPVQAFIDRGADFLTAPTLAELVPKMNALAGSDLIDLGGLERVVGDRDRQVAHGFGSDPQLAAIYAARRYVGDKLTRVVAPHELLDPAAGPLIAVRLHILTRKTLGGLHTDLQARVLDAVGDPISGLYAAGEAAGFGGGGMHGYRALEGTFLGGCLFSGRVAARAVTAHL